MMAATKPNNTKGDPAMNTCVEPQMTESLKNHVLEQVLGADRFQAFRMREPGQGRNMSTLITFTPEGIVIQGDLTPGRNGNVSCRGYGVGWFRGRLSERYLAEKFLEKDWYPEAAARHLRQHLEEIASGNEEAKPGDVEKIQDLISRCEDGDLYVEGFRDDWGEIEEEWESLPGYDYKPSEHAWLCVIQRKFAELYNAKPNKWKLPAYRIDSWGWPIETDAGWGRWRRALRYLILNLRKVIR